MTAHTLELVAGTFLVAFSLGLCAGSVLIASWAAQKGADK